MKYWKFEINLSVTYSETTVIVKRQQHLKDSDKLYFDL